MITWAERLVETRTIIREILAAENAKGFAAALAELREHIKQERAAQDEMAADHSELSGHDWQTERCYGAVEALDRLLATMDRMETGQ